MKKKILIVINSDLFIRNYIKTNVFKELEKNYETYFFANNEINNKSNLLKKKKFLGFFNYSKKDRIVTSRIMNISMWRYRERSKSFLYRVKWFSEINLFELKKNFSLKNVIIKLIRIFNVLKFNIYIRILGNKLIFPFFKKYYIDKIEVLEQLEKKILEIKPNLVIFPTQSQTKADYDLVRICKKNKIKTFFIIDNWDNLSDKSIMLYKPDYLGVWGQQTKKHAIQIQKFKSKFDSYKRYFEYYY